MHSSRLFLCAAFALIFLGASFPALAVSAKTGIDSPLSVDEYWSLVDTSRQSVDALKNLPAEQIKSGLEKLAVQWDAVTEVRMSDGKIIPIDNSYLIGSLRAEKPIITDIENILVTLQTAHRLYPSQVFSTADLDLLTQILARPEFQWKTQSNPINDWLQKQWENFISWLNRVLGNRTISIGNGLWSPLAIIAGLLLALVLVYVFRSLFADLINELQLKNNGGAANEILTSDVAFKRAQTLSQGGDYRSAVRYLYLSSLLLLDERGLLRYDRSKTNHEYLKSISDAPELSEPLKEVIEIFDNVWYGYHELDEESFKHYSDRVEELKEKKQ